MKELGSSNSNYRMPVPGRRLLAACALLAILLQCASLMAQEMTTGSLPPLEAGDSTYQLDYGDRIRINVFNQPELSGEYMLDADGRFSMPLIGTVDAAGMTASELEALLVGAYKPDYLVNPRIFIQVMNYRPYYLIGEVLGTGAFPYRAGMTYLTAIAIAGGFTYRAKQEHVFVIRADDPEQQEIKLSTEEKVKPGDIIRVAERLF
jgi:polysaccharide export outer membrane protein